MSQTRSNNAGASVLYMNWLSPPARAVMMVSAAIGKPLELKNISTLDGEHKTPEYLKKNPQHTIPMLEEGEFRVWDSHAIIAYLVSAYAKNDELYPKDLKRRAIVDQRMHFEGSVLFASFLDAIIPVVKKQVTGLTKSAVERIENGLEILDKFLDGQPWVAGSYFSAADLSCLTSVTGLNEIVPESVKKYSNIVRWLEKCQTTLPYYEEMNAKGNAELGKVAREIFNIKN